MILTVLLTKAIPHINYEGENVLLAEALNYVMHNERAINHNKVIYSNEIFAFVESKEDILIEYNIPKGIYVLDYYSHTFIIPSMEFDICNGKNVDIFNIHDIENIMKELARDKNKEDRNFNNDSIYITEDNVTDVINYRIMFPSIDDNKYYEYIKKEFEKNSFIKKILSDEEMDKIINTFE